MRRYHDRAQTHADPSRLNLLLSLDEHRGAPARNRPSSGSRIAALLLVGATLGGCAGAAGDSSTEAFGAAAPRGAGGVSGMDEDRGAAGTPPVEHESESTYRAPVSTGRFIWSANPDSGRVARVDATTLAVELYDAGFRPTAVAALPTTEGEAAIVLNEGSLDATLLAVDVQGATTMSTFPVHAGATGWTISPDGSWAVAWTDAALVTSPDPLDGYQDVTLIHLASKKATRLSVGFRPSRWFFSADGAHAYAVTEDGLSALALAGGVATLDGLIALSAGGSTERPDVTLTADGALALVRQNGRASVEVIELAGRTRTAVTLSGAVTDLDLAADGKSAVAAVRESAELVILPVPGIATDPDTFETLSVPGELVGSVALSEDGRLAVAYTSAVKSERMTLVDLEDATHPLRTVSLKAPLAAAFPSRDGSHVVTLMGAPVGSTKLGAFAVVPRDAERAPKIVGTEAPPSGVALAHGASTDLITVEDVKRGRFGVYIAQSATLQVDYVELASRPLAAGLITTNGVEIGYVAQEHSEGRITFIDLKTGGVRTLTGFELGARVVE